MYRYEKFAQPEKEKNSSRKKKRIEIKTNGEYTHGSSRRFFSSPAAALFALRPCI
jgi:hypothetical protein